MQTVLQKQQCLKQSFTNPVSDSTNVDWVNGSTTELLSSGRILELKHFYESKVHYHQVLFVLSMWECEIHANIMSVQFANLYEDFPDD